jgi:GWxTD domain-containing protein
LPVAAFAFGPNDLQVELGDAPSRQVRVENYGLDVTDDASWQANIDLIAALVEDDAQLRQLRDTPANARAAAWADFWHRLDPDPSTPENERLEAHYRRVEYARRELRDGFRDGAQSDRGRVYIRYGPPDSIEQRGMLSSTSASFELWQYYQQGLTFYFRDSDGLGHYRLVWKEQR